MNATPSLDTQRCYSALLSRDARFDGRFFTAVLTTGIYCRPVCPARTPKRENVRFYPCAAAAEEAGFRPCRRCRPETAPGTPAWLGTSATVQRSLRLIEAGALDDDTLGALAGRVGVGERHLRRLFVDHLGASPIAFARTHRAHLARRLLDETDLPITEVAFAAGFRSIRRFNDTMRDVFGATPSALRTARRKPNRGTAGRFSVRLPYRAPFDAEALFGFFAHRAVTGLEVADATRYRRAVRLDGHMGTVTIESHVPGALQLTVEGGGLLRLTDLLSRARRLCDLGADPLALAATLGTDTTLADLLAQRPGLRLPGSWDFFELAVRAVLGQQVSVVAARTLATRLVARCGETVETTDGQLTHLFPSAAALAEADLDGLGLTGARIATLRALAGEVAAGRLAPSELGDLETAVARLTEIRGIGPWTAHYIAMRGLGETDAFPAGDLVVRQALANGTGNPISPRVAEECAAAWRPWRAYAVVHLWKSAADAAVKGKTR